MGDCFPGLVCSVSPRPGRGEADFSGSVDEGDIHAGEADDELAAVDLGDAHGFADQGLADEEIFAGLFDAAVGAHATHGVVRVVGRLGDYVRTGPARGLMPPRRRGLSQGLLWPLMT